MCINPPFHQEPLDVMSTDDSGVLPGPPTSTTVLSVDTSITSDTLPTSTMKPQVTTTVASSSQTLESSVDTPTKGASQASLASLSSLSESNDDSRMTRFKVTSVDALSLDGEQGERREHANSEFEIMRVVTDLDNSTAHTRQPASTDESLHISKGESGSEEDATSLSEASRIDSMASSDITLSEPLPATAVQENLSDPNASIHVGNGSNVPPGLSRFKRVNMYERGRWTIKDMANTEESQKDPKNPQKLLQEGSAISLLSPATSRKGALSEYSEPPFGAAGDLSSASGMLTDVSSEKDGSGSVIERSSTAAESTLSRRSSMSSLLPDDHFDVESVASASGSTVGRDRDTPEIGLSQPPVTQQPAPPSQPVPTTTAAPVTAAVTVVHTTPLQATQVPPLMTQAPITQQVPVTTLPSVTVASSGVSTMAPTPVSTAQAREEPYASGAVGTAHGPNCTCEACTESR